MMKNVLYRPHLVWEKGRNKKKTSCGTIDLVLIDQQSVGKSLHLMDTVNAKKR
jgi:hypothetical protein